MEFLKGYKTYIIAILGGILSVCLKLGYIDATTYEWLMGVLGSLGLATLRLGVTASGPVK